MEKHQMETKSFIFVSFIGDILMTLEYESKSKEIKWSSILEKITTESWFQSCEKWKFVLELNNLEPDDVLVFDDKFIKITCIKIVIPQIIFESPDGKFLVSISFESCKSWDDERVYVVVACSKAHIKLKELGKDKGAELHPYVYIFHDKNGKELSLYDVLEDPGDDNLIIVVTPKQLYCVNNCQTKFHGPLRDGEQRKIYYEIISFCSVCSFLHCPSCNRYCNHMIGSPECLVSRNM
jgi:hypothetical protein